MIYKILERPFFYNLSQKLLSIISFGNKGMENFLKDEFLGKNVTVLDIGCGTGKFAPIFGEKYTGVDVNADYIAFAKKENPGKFYQSDSSHLNFLQEKFDVVLSICTFHHLNDEQVKETIREMIRLSKGSIYIIDPVFPSKFNWLGYLLFKMDRGEYTRTFTELNLILNQFGFKVLVPKLKNSFPYRVSVFKR